MGDEDVFPVTNSRYQEAAILVRATGDHRLLTRGGNRADDIGSGKLGTRFALEFADCLIPENRNGELVF